MSPEKTKKKQETIYFIEGSGLVPVPESNLSDFLRLREEFQRDEMNRVRQKFLVRRVV